MGVSEPQLRRFVRLPQANQEFVLELHPDTALADSREPQTAASHDFEKLKLRTYASTLYVAVVN
jgi:hypothetical protein